MKSLFFLINAYGQSPQPLMKIKPRRLLGVKNARPQDWRPQGFKTPKKDPQKNYFLISKAWAEPTTNNENKSRGTCKVPRESAPKTGGHRGSRPQRNPSKKSIFQLSI